MPYKNKEDHNRWWRNKRKKYKEENRCIACGCPLDVLNSPLFTCPNCIERTIKNQHLRRSFF